MSAALAKAIRDISNDVDRVLSAVEYDNEESEHPIDINGMRMARGLLRVLAHVANGMDTKKAFGAPGDWGYENAVGQGVLELLSVPTPAVSA